MNLRIMSEKEEDGLQNEIKAYRNEAMLERSEDQGSRKLRSLRSRILYNSK